MAQSKRQYFSVIAEPELGPPRGGDPDPGGATSVAAVLRRARQQTGYALPDVATTLRIRLRYLEAIEDGRFDDLPGSVYAVGFIRTYAEFLNLDAEEMVRRFKDEVAGVDRQTELNFPAPAAESRVPGGAVLMIAAVLAMIAYGGWYYLSSAERGVGDLVPALPDRFAALLSEEPVALAPEPGSPGSESPGPASPGAGPAPTSPPSAGPSPADPAPADPAPADPTLTGPTAPGAPAANGAAEATRLAEDSGAAAGPAATGDGLAGLPPDGPPGSGAGPLAPPPAETWGPQAAPAGDVASRPLGPEAAPGPAGRSAAGPSPTPPSPTAPSPGSPSPGSPSAGGTVALESVPGGAASGAGAAPGTPVPPGAAQASSDPAGSIVIRAVADSWVQVRDAEGALVMTRVLRPGDVYAVPDRPGLTLVTGNAGGLEISVDGRPVPSIGGPGDVVRGVVLDGQRLLQGSAVGG